MTKAPARLAVAAVLAAVAAAVQALRLNAVPLLDAASVLDLSALQVLLPALGLVGVVMSPVLVSVAGYAWGSGADVRADYPQFAGVLAGATFLGFVLTYLATFVASLRGAGTGVEHLLPRLAAAAVFSLETLSIPVAGLAGAAVAHFRTTDRRRGDPAATPDRDPTIDRRGASTESRREQRERERATE